MKKNLKTIDTLRERERESYNLKNKNCKGVTLIALIITIIILLILAVTSVVLIMRWNIVDKTEMAAEGYQGASEKDAIELGYDEYALDKTTGNESANLTVDGATVDDNTEETGGWTVKFPSGNVYTVDKNGKITGPTIGDGGENGGLLGDQPSNGPQVTVEGQDQPVTLTEGNVKEYLGKEVKGFKTSEEDTETVTVGTNKTGGTQSVTVSTTYRLYYVDFEGKYGEEGAVYLKADCTSYTYKLKQDDTADTAKNVKIKNLNPELYKAKEVALNKDNNNMKAVTWLLHTDNWETLRTTVSSTYRDSVEYIVGAPPLEMMMDSYNTHYDLLGETTPYIGEIPADGTRKKLFYQYPYSGVYIQSGYGVGPHDSYSYGTMTSNNAVQTDANVNTMYYPGPDQCYWLASPSANNAISLMRVHYSNGGIVSYAQYSLYDAFCPLVCLKSSTDLTLEQGASD